MSRNYRWFLASSDLVLITMNYLQAVEYIESFGVFGIKAGLERIECLLAELGNPQKQLNCIHVAGTNGKGSVCTLLEVMLADFKVGKFTSPHLVSYNERFCVNGQNISEQDFAALVAKLRPLVETMPAELKPTQFEILTAMAFVYFADCGVEYAIIEVGLGGLLDSTNVITPLVSVITNVDMDHMDKCGDTLTEIAGHKAGIIKVGVPVVTAACGEALVVIKERALALACECLVYDEQFTARSLPHLCADFRQQFHYCGDFGQERLELEATINLLGEHQLLNAAVAITTIFKILGAEQTRVLAKNLTQANWAGRLEIVAHKPFVLLDGAHNLAGAKVLRATLEQLFRGKKLCFVLGFMQDKDIKGILTSLVQDNDAVIPVLADPQYPRSASIEYIGQFLSPKQVLTAPGKELTHAEAVQAAREFVGPDGVVCLAGSLYFIGRIKQEKIF